MQTVKDKHIWIIGASSGIGQALAIELANQGAKLALTARREDKLKEVQKGLKNSDDHMIAAADVGDYASLKKAKAKIMKGFGKLDSAIFMAALYSPHDGKPKPITQIHDMLTVNIGGAFNVIDLVQPHYESQGHGQIVLCASVAGYRGLPTGQPYCASKAALINLGESLRVDLEPKNIDVKIISPGFVKTPLTDKNDFQMPMIIESDQAAKAIVNGLESKVFEIHFPKRFTYLMKFLKILPNILYFWLAKQTQKKMRA